MNRAYSIIEFKSVDDDKRIITGIASTPSPDRMDDIVEPLGAEFKLPLPLLWQHDSGQPIGHVIKAKATAKGIEITAQLASIAEPGVLKDRLDLAWQSIKSGLVRGLSIGFKGLETARIGDTWGQHFLKWLWLELSAVTIPANGEATITSIKSIDSGLRAASGQKQDGDTPGVSGKSDRVIPVSIKPKRERSPQMDVAEQIKSYDEARKAKATRMGEIMEASAKRGESLNAEEIEEYEGLETELKTIDSHLKRLRDYERIQGASARAVERVETPADGSQARDPARHTMVKTAPKSEPGVRFARLVKCFGLASKLHENPVEIAQRRYANDPALIEVIKGNVVAASTSSSTWAGNLVGDETSVFADFVEYLRPQTILGRFGTGGVPSLRRVPFRTALIGQTGKGSGYWVGEGKPKPLTSWTYGRTTLEPLKVANIAVVTMEILRDASPSADVLLRDELAAALRERLDIDFIDPNKSASSGVSPASILNGISGIPSTGNAADDVREDIRLLFGAFIAANNAPTSGVWVMAATTALALSLMMNPLGQAEFPGITMNGGTLFGLPVIVSEYVTSDSSGSLVALINASDIYLGDEGGINVDMSDQASLQMLDNPTNDTVTPTATQMVSLWQTNSVGFRAERTVNWARRRSSAVAYLSAVNWGVAA